MDDIYERSLAGDITKKDALMLIESNPFQLFDVADKLRKEIVGDEVTFVVNRNIDITDQCMIKCEFCSFRNSIGYEMNIDEILESVKEAKEFGASEICLFGGIMPHMTVEYFCEIISGIKNNFDIELHTLSPVEVFHAAKASNMSTRDALKAFKKAGLGTMTGASAEILVDSVRAQICPKKVSTDEWVQIITEAHEVGIKTTSTIMYGTVETWEDRIDHLMILRDIQRKTGGFTELVPMTFLSDNNKAGQKTSGVSGMEDLKLHAMARIILGRDIPNIQASWIKIGTRMAQVALNCGANDLGGTMMEDKISIAAGASHGEHLPREGMIDIIKGIDRIPVERNTLYERV
ncbi:5-amino-6-(D-ribitylamino)uracil--L-tyrosine 4-hydroxyphenyl transferase CofH [Methanobacterium alcaliphilum]|uniref:5-amino-6-(D-ribitylamino)uracil--L-tyrosine 4-hydroxyphenyl transferase CofH n=1 Tax=Methanobacterium alcaliphilum TaxID=392018 RepID=UPI00200A72E4|nr:5-amino-6-(D-ribitylamino)uracil--L-tyrosine 4-hydroxyphenyl transferase CofH [Methanobacterium alcaliphilum]MCK9151879.1 5-amino-6-(D-ribitylamino)uracil--L-tyrosine 4-hydroxyphenyl transferase CofH [Methanobacterium alcaliphilum]